MRSIPRNLIKDQVYCVNYIVYLDDSNQQHYSYVAIKNSDMPEFQEAIKQESLDLNDFGIVLEEGEGEASDIIKDKMRHLYNCRHDNAAEIDSFELVAN